MLDRDVIHPYQGYRRLDFSRCIHSIYVGGGQIKPFYLIKSNSAYIVVCGDKPEPAAFVFFSDGQNCLY
jgi:hypothetical protein